jgi:large subunit ribosomal protein L28
MSKRCDLLNVSPVSGNNVSHSNRKTKRRFLPNLNKLSFKSEALGIKINLKIAASTLRTINKYGNIDNFLVNYRFNKLSETAIKYRSKITKALAKKGELENLKIKSRKVSA